MEKAPKLDLEMLRPARRVLDGVSGGIFTYWLKLVLIYTKVLWEYW